MNGYIDVDDAIRIAIQAVVDVVGHGITQVDAVNIVDKFNEVPLADVVEVVRCKNCSYYREETSYCLNPHCSSSFYGHRVKENHYCSYGERREI